MVGLVDDAHAATPYFRQNLVLADDEPGRSSSWGRLEDDGNLRRRGRGGVAGIERFQLLVRQRGGRCQGGAQSRHAASTALLLRFAQREEHLQRTCELRESRNVPVEVRRLSQFVVQRYFARNQVREAGDILPQG